MLSLSFTSVTFFVITLTYRVMENNIDGHFMSIVSSAFTLGTASIMLRSKRKAIGSTNR
jgi:hypothetical protein